MRRRETFLYAKRYANTAILVFFSRMENLQFFIVNCLSKSLIHFYFSDSFFSRVVHFWLSIRAPCENCLVLVPETIHLPIALIYKRTVYKYFSNVIKFKFSHIRWKSSSSPVENVIKNVVTIPHYH